MRRGNAMMYELGPMTMAVGGGAPVHAF